MKRRTPKRKTSGSAAPHAHPVNHCRAIVPVDGTAIRKKIKKDYKKALRDMDTSRRQLEQFHQVDLPQFTRWFNTHFGAFLTELREVGQKLAADQVLIFQVNAEMIFGGNSYARAYQQVMEFRENPEPPPPTDGGASREGGDPFGARQEGASADADEEPFEALFNELFGEFGPDERAGNKHGPHDRHHTKNSAPAHGTSRLKELYRALVRRLHPDAQRNMAQATEWWHQAQVAYNAGDAEQLEVILTLCEIGDSGTTANTSASLLQRITTKLKTSIREIKAQLSVKRRDPAWSFSIRTDHDTMAVKMRRELTGQLEELREHYRRTQELIAGWKAAADRLKPLRRRKRTTRTPSNPF